MKKDSQHLVQTAQVFTIYSKIDSNRDKNY